MYVPTTIGVQTLLAESACPELRVANVVVCINVPFIINFACTPVSLYVQTLVIFTLIV